MQPPAIADRPTHVGARVAVVARPAAPPSATPAKIAHSPQGGQVGGWVGESRVQGHDRDTRPEKPDLDRRRERARRLHSVLVWMVENGITNRAAVFAGCPEARNSAALHHAAITALKKDGLIERVWKEYVFCVEDHEARAWLATRGVQP